MILFSFLQNAKGERRKEDMKKQIIYIYGASGSGTSTLGGYICDQLGYFFMDTDDYFWELTNPPYQRKRKISDRLDRMKKDLASHDKIVLCGSS